MKNALPISMVLVSLFAVQPSFGLPFEPRCCACVALNPDAHDTGGTAGMAPTRALACAEILNGEQQDQFGATCEERGGGKALCVLPVSANEAVAQPGDMLDCNALLLEENIACPALAPAPALGIPALAGLGLLLAGLGAWTVRRRRTLSRD